MMPWNDFARGWYATPCDYRPVAALVLSFTHPCDQPRVRGCHQPRRPFFAVPPSGQVIPTISYENRSKIAYQTFLDLHATLEETFPRVHNTFERTVVANYSLLYTWTGTEPGALPPCSPCCCARLVTHTRDFLPL